MLGNAARRHVLIVDDDAAQRVLITRILSLHKLNVQEAASGEQALDLLNDSVPDLIILDMQMPVMAGPETLARIQEKLGDRTPPVVGLSGAATDDAADLGFSDYIMKPFNISMLGDRIRPYVDLDD
jgi:two-component system phosphate regulon response regulator PhoB